MNKYKQRLERFAPRQPINDQRATRKQELIQMLGGACAICGYDKNPAALEFDHKEPSQKRFSIGAGLSQRNKIPWLEVVEEAQKCRLLCANCHRDVTWPAREKARER